MTSGLIFPSEATARDPLFNGRAGVLVDKLDGFFKADLDRWSRPDLAELRFKSLRERLVRMQALAERLYRMRLELLPDAVVIDVDSAVDMVRQTLESIAGVSMMKMAEQREDPRSREQQLFSEFEPRALTFEKALAAAIAYLGALVQDSKPTEDLNAEIAQIQSLVTSAAKSQGEIQRIERDARSSLQLITTEKHGRHFGSEARQHQKWSYAWLGTTVLTAVITGILAWVNYTHVLNTPKGSSSPDLAQLILAKLLLFSIGISATIWCAKVYLAHRHNYVVNRHRQNALNSFETFLDAASDEMTKNTVLIQAMQAIYAPQPSGYSNLQVDAPGSTQLIEMIKAGSSAK